MRVAVTDANIFIDIVYLKIHTGLFKIGYEIYTTQYVLNELDEEQVLQLQDLIKDNVLIVYPFTEQELTELDEFFIKRGLSYTDHSVLFIATKMNAVIISGDSLIRTTCQQKKWEVHGILWLLDECINCKYLTSKEASEKLSDLMIFNKRLPAKDCELRLVKWQKP